MNTLLRRALCLLGWHRWQFVRRRRDGSGGWYRRQEACDVCGLSRSRQERI
jgi:hypothetical protein